MAASFAEIFLEAMRYEHWLRFYFAADAPLGEGEQPQASEEGNDAVIDVPADYQAGARAEDLETLGLTSITAYSKLSGFSAN